MSADEQDTRCKFTRTQQAMLDVLSDGKPHGKPDLVACLYDDLGAASNVDFHLSMIRRILRERGEDIVCRYLHRKYLYQWVRVITTKE